MAANNMEAYTPATFIITASVLELSETQFCEKLMKDYPQMIDFTKIRTPSEFSEFRDSLALKFLSDADLQTLRKVSIALYRGNATPPVVVAPKETLNEAGGPKLSRRQLKNKRTRANNKKRKQVAAPTLVQGQKVLRKRGWPQPKEPPIKRTRIDDIVFSPSTPPRMWMASIAPVKMSQLEVRELITVEKTSLVDGTFASRTEPEHEYRHRMGIHPRADDCDICDCAYRYHFFDDFEGVKTRLFAFVALHHWIKLGGSVRSFNWYPQTWQNQIVRSDGSIVPVGEMYGILKLYIDMGKVRHHNHVSVKSDADGEITFKEGRDPDPKMSFRLTR
jgi:hypothetical protein